MLNYNIAQTVILSIFMLALIGLVIRRDFKLKVLSAVLMFVSLSWFFGLSALRLGKVEGIAIGFFMFGIAVVYLLVGFVLRRT